MPLDRYPRRSAEKQSGGDVLAARISFLHFSTA
jgi:hypothetical protein